MTQNCGYCPLCSSNEIAYYHADKKREYWRCSVCQLIFVPKAFHLSALEEKSIYDLHINDPSDLGYRTFLQRFIDPLVNQLCLNSNTNNRKPLGLDFGCGPGPTLSLMLQELGFDCVDFDIYYANDKSLLKPDYYDFVTSTEVVEHLSQPYHVFNCMFSLLKPNGSLAIMTKRSDTLERFKTWHYIQDPTHICFYNEASFNWIAQQFSMSVSFPTTDVAIFSTN